MRRRDQMTPLGIKWVSSFAAMQTKVPLGIVAPLRVIAVALTVLASGSANAGDEWTAWTSEEDAPVTCGDGFLVGGSHCNHVRCDNQRLWCDQDSGGYVPHGANRYWTDSFSEEGDGKAICAEGYYATGMACAGHLCDNVSLECTYVGSWDECSWTDWVSSNSGAEHFDPGLFAVGAQCRGANCSNVRYYVCDPLCVEGTCSCRSSCDGRQCGSDGCGGSCGTCGDMQSCNSESKCVCNHECSRVGQKKCVGNKVSTCRSNSHGCRYWARATPCAYGCDNNQCNAAPYKDLKPVVNFSYPGGIVPKGKIYPGQAFQVRMEICNTGNATAGASTTRLKVTDSQGITANLDQSTPSLAADACDERVWSFAGGLGLETYTFRVFADHGNAIQESNENNNSTWTVRHIDYSDLN